MVNKLKILLFSLLVFFVSPRVVRASELPVVIINQIRGEESCCQKGSTQLIESIAHDEVLKDMPMGWAFRYDALKNDSIVKWLNSSQEAGLLLEITPRLASDSGVTYKGKADGSDWYHGKNSMLIGYSQEERKKLIDTAMDKFFSYFARYPSFTVSWMIDGWSLNYIEKKYSVKLHEITKEQFETDSYTLDGGIFNAGYYPAVSHPLIPGTSDKLDIVMVRQTISDPERNYGSSQTFYTSQPNDYLSDPEGTGFKYFTDLLSWMENQQAKQRVGVLGFENSYEWSKYGNEYIRQIEEIKKQAEDKKINPLSPVEYAEFFHKTNSENKPFYFARQFSTSSSGGVLWYFGKTYRVRILLREKELILDDLRLFSSSEDPYAAVPAKFDYAYWIVPYVWNGSQMYTVSPQNLQMIKNKKINGNSISDLYTDPFGIAIPRTEFKTEEDGESLSIRLSENKTIRLNPEDISLMDNLNSRFSPPVDMNLSDLFGDNYHESFYFKNHPSFNIESSVNSVDIGWKAKDTFIPLLNLAKSDESIVLTPQTILKNIEMLNPIFQPDRANSEIDPRKSILYWNNKKAIAGRNPIRLFVLPLNEYGRVTSVASISVELSPRMEKARIDYPSDYSYRITPWFIDITGSVPFASKITVTLNGVKMISDVPVEMVEDCSEEVISCITHPLKGISYLFVRLEELKRNFSAK